MTKKNAIIRRLVNIEYLVVKDINDADHARLSGPEHASHFYLRRISFLLANIFYCCQILKPFSSSKAI